MIALATAAFPSPVQFDSRRAWWRRFVQSLGRRMHALAAERRRRRAIRPLPDFEAATSAAFS